MAGMNKLQHFPKVDDKSHIKVLNLEHNLIRAVPPDITNFHNVVHLNASYNQITVLPKEIQYLSSLKDHALDFSTFPITQAIIPSIK
jgi:Leucine-rich repeat (LRR) protein